MVEVTSSPLLVSTEQATVQGVLTTQQIEQLPINGRNFLDLAQLEPGVQIQDGSNCDPTKNGYSSISFGGRFGRTARIEVDGVDISDETVGTTTQNIPASAIQEFQIAQSSLDLSTELTSSGGVNVSTRSGSNEYHGEAFGYGRWHNVAARIAPSDLFFRREQFGGNVGGPVLKEKLFFFMDWERTRQDLLAPVQVPAPFSALSSSFNSPFKEHEALGRLDWQAKPTVHVFYRFTYNIHSDVVPFVPNTFQPFLNRDHTQDHVAGVDFNTGQFTHSVRFGYLRFANQITDATAGSNIFNPASQIELAIGSDPFCLTAGADPFCSGPNFLAPQATQQHNVQLKYDGGKAVRSHILRYGVNVNRVLVGGFAKFLALAPAVQSSATATPVGSFPGGASNPLNYPVQGITLGNGQGFATAIPLFGFPAGGQFDTRFSWYIGDAWKAKPNLTINYGVRYVRDTGRDDNNLPPVPALEQFGPGLGRKTHQPSRNFAPQLGIAWDPGKNGKTVIRAGAGLFYENAVFNNVLFDAPARLPKGLFLAFQSVCPGSSVTLPDGTMADVSKICGQPIGAVASQIAALQQQYQAATLKVGAQSNPVFIGNALTDSSFGTSTNLISPDYRTPFSWQFNGGVQHEFKGGALLSVDYLRNVGLHFLLDYDTNHVGDARFLNLPAAIAAINTTNQAFGCPAGSAGIDCAISSKVTSAITGNTGASIADYAAGGLDSGNALNFGSPTPNAAFAGINPNLGTNQMLFPIGRSVYNALQVSLRQNVRNPLRGVRRMNLQASYALSRYRSTARDGDFINNATDFASTNRFFGPNGLDRTHQFSFSGVMDLPFMTRISLISHVDSGLPVTLFLPSSGLPGEIFRSDVTGDGTFAGATVLAAQGDVLPGTNLGSFGRDIKADNVNSVIQAYNSTGAGKLTPAGQALVTAALFTQQQLVALGAVTPTVGLPPKGQVGPGSLFTADLRLAWEFKPIKARESFVIEPNVAVFNLFNSANYDGPSQPLNGLLDGSAGTANGTTYKQRTNRITLGSGVFALGEGRASSSGG